jgi:putative membrane protein
MSQPTPGFSRARLLRRIAILAVIVVPLAFAGLFIGSLSQADKALGAIPAAIVNNDVLVNQVATDGTKTPILAGRQLVTELTGPKKTGFDWTITNSKDAAQQLKDGTIFAILTVPKDFSKSIVSLSGDSPKQAAFSIHTDSAHSYITGAVAQVVGQSLTSAFGAAVTKQYISGLYSGLGSLGTSLGTAADGASSLADGATSLGDGASSLGDGLDSLATGATSAASGAHSLATGTKQYTGGVDSLSTGLGKLDTGAAKLDGVSSGVKSYTDGVGTISTNLTKLNSVIQSYPTIDAQTKAAMAQLTAGLSKAAAGGPTLASGAKTGIDGVQSGIHQSAVGAKALSGGSSKLVSGTKSLATGLDKLADGASSAAAGATKLAGGATKLATGATKLSDGLESGSKQVPTTSTKQAAKTADVASDPVGFSVKTDNPVPSLSAGISTLFVPLGLWIGALAVFLVLRPVNRRSLTSTANNRRLVFSQVTRATIVTAAQAVLLTVLIFLTGGDLSWSLLPAVLGFSLLMAIAFTAFHYLITVGLGRGGLIVSLLLLAVQITSTGGLYPIELLAKPFQVVSPFLPLTYGIAGMQNILTGAPAGPGITAVIVLALFAIACILVALAAIRRTRRATALGLVPSTT